MGNAIIYDKKVHYNPFLAYMGRLISPLIVNALGYRIKRIDGGDSLITPCIIASHHEEKIDQFVIAKKIKNRLFWVADTSRDKPLCDTYIRKRIMQKIGVVPIDKRNPKRMVNLFEYLIFLLEKGESVVLFPEGLQVSQYPLQIDWP